MGRSNQGTGEAKRVLDNNSRWKGSEIFNKVILSLVKGRQEDRLQEIACRQIKRSQSEGKKWVIRIRGANLELSTCTCVLAKEE